MVDKPKERAFTGKLATEIYNKVAAQAKQEKRSVAKQIEKNLEDYFEAQATGNA